MFLFSTHLLF